MIIANPVYDNTIKELMRRGYSAHHAAIICDQAVPNLIYWPYTETSIKQVCKDALNAVIDGLVYEDWKN